MFSAIFFLLCSKILWCRVVDVSVDPRQTRNVKREPRVLVRVLISRVFLEHQIDLVSPVDVTRGGVIRASQRSEMRPNELSLPQIFCT